MKIYIFKLMWRYSLISYIYIWKGYIYISFSQRKNIYLSVLWCIIVILFESYPRAEYAFRVLVLLKSMLAKNNSTINVPYLSVLLQLTFSVYVLTFVNKYRYPSWIFYKAVN